MAIIERSVSGNRTDSFLASRLWRHNHCSSAISESVSISRTFLSWTKQVNETVTSIFTVRWDCNVDTEYTLMSWKENLGAAGGGGKGWGCCCCCCCIGAAGGGAGVGMTPPSAPRLTGTLARLRTTTSQSFVNIKAQLLRYQIIIMTSQPLENIKAQKRKRRCIKMILQKQNKYGRKVLKYFIGTDQCGCMWMQSIFRSEFLFIHNFKIARVQKCSQLNFSH